MALCGRNAVQISPSARQVVSLPELAQKLQAAGRVFSNPYLVRLEVDQHQITVFADGRTIVAGTEDLAVARAMHAKYVGS